MDNSNIHRIVKIEEHWLPTCQCSNCIEERKRRETIKSEAHLQTLSPQNAYVLGFVSSQYRSGSLAREMHCETAQDRS